MNKREFLQMLTVGTAGIAGTALLNGCMLPRVGENVNNERAGDPYRCQRCGYLTRSRTDISGDRCPRCRARLLKRITEDEMAGYLAQEAAVK